MLAIARAIVEERRLLLIADPTTGLSPAIYEHLIAAVRLLQETPATILLVEHKMDVVRRLSDRMIVLHNGALVADGTPAEVVASPIVQEAYLGVRRAADA
jgi:branched-chain amino acid transport system ATP-binding protein